MSHRYFNEEAYPFIQGDTFPSFIFTINDSSGAPADFSSYPSIIVQARFREKNAALSLAVITCAEVDSAIGQFRISSWPATVTNAETGKHELEIQVDYLGDGTQVQTVYTLVEFKVFEQFGDTI